MKHPLFLIHFGKRLEDKLSFKENTNKKRRKEERKKEKDTDRKENKLNAPHVMYNVKILSQQLINRDK